MGWSRPDEESRADHYHDERKHDWRPGDRGFEAAARDELPARLDRPITTAEDIAITVMQMKDVTNAAALIDLYAQSVAAGARREQHQETAATALGKPVDIIFGGE
jgi:hypothetical protein